MVGWNSLDWFMGKQFTGDPPYVSWKKPWFQVKIFLSTSPLSDQYPDGARLFPALVSGA